MTMRVRVLLDGHPDHQLETTMVDAPGGRLPPEVYVPVPGQFRARWIEDERTAELKAVDLERTTLVFELTARLHHPGDLKVFDGARAVYNYRGKVDR